MASDDILILTEEVGRVTKTEYNVNNRCTICTVREINTVCSPCGHQCLCAHCSDARNEIKKCPICRARCRVIKTFMTGTSL